MIIHVVHGQQTNHDTWAFGMVIDYWEDSCSSLREWKYSSKVSDTRNAW